MGSDVVYFLQKTYLNLTQSDGYAVKNHQEQRRAFVPFGPGRKGSSFYIRNGAVRHDGISDLLF